MADSFQVNHNIIYIMSDREALKIFSRQPVSSEMINYLVATTNSIIQVKSSKPKYNHLSTSDLIINPISKGNISLVHFIKNLIKYSNVQTPTLMATLIYLNKLRSLLPANAIGMETTRHRIFLSALILSAKSLNDSSPLNKHWTKYTDGLLNIEEVNMAERELIGLLNWNITINEDDLIIALQPFLIPIKNQLAKKLQAEQNQKINFYRLSNFNLKSYSKSRSSSTSSVNSYTSVNSPLSNSSSVSSIDSISSSPTNYSLNSMIAEEYKKRPLQNRSVNTLHKFDSMSHGRIIA